MKYKVKLPDGTAQFIQITSAYFKTWHVWLVKFDDGRTAMLFKMGGEWMQRTEDFLEFSVLKELGSFIDRIIIKRKIALG
jgi:hypothetical protein